MRQGAGAGAAASAPVDQFSPWLLPTLTRLLLPQGAYPAAELAGVLTTAGFTSIAWHDLHAVIIKAATATT